MTDMIGQSIGRYQILARLGEGGMAVVYKARDTRLERDVALKLIRLTAFPAEMHSNILARFEREAKSLARLSHPSIVTVFDYGEHDGAPFLALEYCPGGDLKNRLTGQPMDWREAIQLILPIARAMSYSHKQGIIHRDVKPSNVMFTGEGDPKLSDFGIAKMLETDNVATLTGTGVGIGTPGYMAPEQWTGETSPQSDQYGLGVVLYELLTGRKPYEADTPAGILIKQTSQPLPPPRQFTAAIPTAVESAILKVLDRDPAERYPDMDAFIKAFEGLLQQTPVVETLTTIRDPNKTLAVVPVVVVEERPRTPTPVDLKTPATPLTDTKPINWKMIIIGAAALVVLVGIVWGGWQFSRGSLFVPKPSATPSQTATPRPTDTPVATPTPELGIGSTLTREKDGMVMVYVPADEFIMGSDADDALAECQKFTSDCDRDWFTDEEPPHQVSLDAYYIDVYEVSNAQYQLCVDAGACDPLEYTGSYTRDSYYGDSQYDDYPVIYVDWNQAKAYCTWAGADLPTEAQWEKAARGTDGRMYPWGNSFDDTNANFCDNSCTFDWANKDYDDGYEDTAPVDAFPGGVSIYGAYNLSGNVWEWVNDWYDAYPGNITSNSDYGTTSRILRGGAYGSYVDSLCSSNRSWDNPGNRNYDLGFRCSRSAASP